jgi:hypothetical protein
LKGFSPKSSDEPVAATIDTDLRSFHLLRGFSHLVAARYISS